jgi:archaetidylinositol phosphate synthase
LSLNTQVESPLLTKLKKNVQKMLTSQATAAHKIGLTPNKITIIGFIFILISAGSYLEGLNYSRYPLILAVVLFLLSGFCDALDGIVARTFQQTTQFGGFLDSLLDRYADAAIFAAIIIAGLSNAAWTPFFGATWGAWLGTVLGLTAMSGSLLVSYTRARAEAIGIKMESVGLAERAERMLILAAVTVIGFFWLPAIGYGVAVLAVLANFTVIQRVAHVYKILKTKN